MKNRSITRVLSLVLCVLLTLASAVCMSSCGKEEEAPASDAAAAAEAVDIGEGAHSFTLTVTDKDGGSTVYAVHTDKTVVGEALQELGLIDGEEGEFGLYVKVVNGVTADYDTDGTYWAFYIGGEYAMTGADVTEIADGESYAFKVEK